jgi:phosphatidylinositol alpha-1,6-mannosyltransferase
MQVLKNRRVLLLTETYSPEIGGIQNYLSELMAQMSPVHTFVLAGKQENADAWDARQKYKIVRFGMNRFFIPRWRPAYKILEKAVMEFHPEVIVCGKALFEGRAAYRIFKKMGIPYVVMTYGMEINTWLKNWKTKRDLLRVLESAQNIFVINEQIKNSLIKELKNKGNINCDGKFVKMYPGVDDYFSQPSGDTEKTKKELEIEDRKVIVSVCRIVRRKGIDVVIKAMKEIKKEIPNVTYIVLGDGPEKDSLEKLAKEIGVDDSIKFLGKVSREKVRAVFQVADLFVLTPRDEDGDMEGFGIVYLEAAMAGLCAVGSKSGGVPEAVINAQTGLLVQENDVHDTAEKMIKLLQDDVSRRGLSNNARARATSEFSWQSRGVLFRGVIESVINNRN